MHAQLIRPGKPSLPLKNLGWLLRHWSEVSEFAFFYAPDKNEMRDGVLCALLKNGSRYQTSFASVTVLFNFLRRPTFDGLTLRVTRCNLDGTTPRAAARVHVIGSPEYRAILNTRAAYIAQTNSYDNAGQYRAQLEAILPPVV